MSRSSLFALLLLTTGAWAAEGHSNLPPDEIVARVLRANPGVQAASSQVRAEEARRQGLEAGQYEWNVKLGGQQRRSNPATSPEERFNEWNAAIERPLRLPGKGRQDAALGAAGVALAETGQGDALHEASRNLLKLWFAWLKEGAATAQWGDQVSLLEKQAQAVKRRQQLGDAAILESIQSEAAVAHAEAQRTQAQIRRSIAAEDLRRRFPGLPLVETSPIAEPQPIKGNEAAWLDAILQASHELGLARGESQKAQILAGRASQELLPDPTVGMLVSRERGGEDHIVGAYVSIPLPGGARRALTDASLAQVSSSHFREAAVRQKVEAEAAALYQSATAAVATWQAGRNAAERLKLAAEMTARAYQLGEGSLNDLLNSRRLANEAALNARLLQLDALELAYRLRLDAHQLWDLD